MMSCDCSWTSSTSLASADPPADIANYEDRSTQMSDPVSAAGPAEAAAAPRPTIGSAPPGADAFYLRRLIDDAPANRWLHVARDDAQAARMADSLRFFAPDVDCLVFPAWDCLPYDRVSPHRDIVARRLDVLTRLLHPAEAGKEVVITTVNALLQRVPTPPAAAPVGAGHSPW